MTPLQQETLREFSEYYTREFEVSDWTNCFLEADRRLCIHVVVVEYLRSIYGWKICKPCLMDLFRIRKSLIKKEKANVQRSEMGRNILESPSPQTDTSGREESCADGFSQEMEVG